MANTYTIHFHLPKPDKGDLDWDDEYHEAMDIVDAQLKSVNDSLTNHTSNTNNPHSTSFIQLTDTPSSYSGLANRVVVVNSTATGLTTVTRVPLAEDSNKVGGLYPGNSANNVLKLDSTGKVPLSNLPIKASDFVEKNFKTATITTTWSGTSAPYTQDVAISGMTSDNKPVIAPVYSDTLETAIAQQEAWNLIDKIVTDEDKITCYCFTDKPEVEIPIQLWVV